MGCEFCGVGSCNLKPRSQIFEIASSDSSSVGCGRGVKTIHFQKSENVKNPVILNHGRKLRKVVIRFTCMIAGRVV